MKFKIQMAIFGMFCGALFAEILPFVEHFHFELDHLSLERALHPELPHVDQKLLDEAAAFKLEYENWSAQKTAEWLQEEKDKWSKNNSDYDRRCQSSHRETDTFSNRDQNERDIDRD